MASKIISIREIPLIAQLYGKGALKAAASVEKPPSSAANFTVGIIRADITKIHVDAIVNAANSALRGGGGVDGAIHRAAGPQLMAECRTIGGCPTGRSVITKGYNLPASHVIHTVGPIYGGAGRDEALLRGCYRESLELAAKNNLRSIAFSGISTGVYGYPSRDAARVACDTVRTYLDENKSSLWRIIFVTFDQKDIDAYNEMIPYVPNLQSL